MNEPLSLAYARTPPPVAPFFARQYFQRATWQQNVFDVIAGVVVPAICLAFDPGISKSGIQRDPILGGFKTLAYTLILFHWIVLLMWLFVVPRTPRCCAVYSGLLFSGAAVAYGLGLVLFPFSTVGLMLFGLGTLGFAPFITGYVFRRNFKRARQEVIATEKHTLKWHAMLGAFAGLAMPLAAVGWITTTKHNALLAIVSDDAVKRDSAIATLKPISIFLDAGDFVTAYECADERKQRQLAHAYRQIKNADLETEIDRRCD